MNDDPQPRLIDLARQVSLTPEDSARAPQIAATPAGPLRVGVDLGTATIVVLVLDQDCHPLAGEYRPAQVARDGLVVDFFGAVQIVREAKERLERRTGRSLETAASAYPPGVPPAEMRATANVLEAAGLRCTRLVDEPTAANAVLALRNGGIVDVGGGTTGIAVLEGGRVIHTADEATGGTHFSLVIAGALGIPFEAAETLKQNPAEQGRLFPTVRPVMEKVGAIISRHTRAHPIKSLTLAGGSAAYPGFDRVIEEYTGIPAVVAPHPMFITPLGIAMNCEI